MEGKEGKIKESKEFKEIGEEREERETGRRTDGVGVGEIPCEDSSVKENEPCRCRVLSDDVVGYE